ncbi:MAG: hypothetical protein ACYCZR_00985 [Burkholderiales bacterium]
MKVRAIKKGYYGLLLREPGMPGSEFTLKDDADFSSKWMERIPDKQRRTDLAEEESDEKGTHAHPKHHKGTRSNEKSVI